MAAWALNPAAGARNTGFPFAIFHEFREAYLGSLLLHMVWFRKFGEACLRFVLLKLCWEAQRDLLLSVRS